jgi:TolB-like protein
MSTDGKFQSFNRRLDSWKEIAAYFRCDERTVRRWEKDRGMPVHRAPGGAGGRVFAYTDELSAWLVAPANDDSVAPTHEGPAVPAAGATAPDGGATGPVAPAAPLADVNDLPPRQKFVTVSAPALPPAAPTAPLAEVDEHPPRQEVPTLLTPNLGAQAPAPAAPTAPLGDVKGLPPRQEVPDLLGAQTLPPTVSLPSKSARSASALLANRNWSISVKLAVALLALLALLAIGLTWMLRAPDTHSIAVLPFANGGSVDTDFLGDGIAESLIDNLTAVPQLKVRPWGSVSRYRGQEFKPTDISNVGADLGVSLLVSGQVVVRGDVIDVHAEITDVRDDTQIWGKRYTGNRSDIVLLQQRIAGDIADKLHSTLSPAQRQKIIRQGTQNPDAYQLFLKGRYAWNRRTPADLDAAIDYFNRAIAEDPGYAQAYLGLADVYAVRPDYWGNPSEDFPRSNAAARRALELEPALAHPHAVLGENQIKFEWDFAGGEAEFAKAFQLDANDATAHQWYADDLGTIGGREQEALEQANLAHRLDPFSPIVTRVIGSVLVSARRYDEAIALCSSLAKDNPNFAVAHDCLHYAYLGKGMYSQTIEELKIYAHLNGGWLPTMPMPWNRDSVRAAGKARWRKRLRISLHFAIPAMSRPCRLLACTLVGETLSSHSSGLTPLIGSMTGC